MLEVHAILQRQRCNENITKKTGTLSDAYYGPTSSTFNKAFVDKPLVFVPMDTIVLGINLNFYFFFHDQGISTKI